MFWAGFTTWLHLEGSLENTKKINKYWLSNIELVFTHTISKLGLLGSAGKLSMPFVTLCKKIQEKFNFFTQGLSKSQSMQVGLIGTLKGNIFIDNRIEKCVLFVV